MNDTVDNPHAKQYLNLIKTVIAMVERAYANINDVKRLAKQIPEALKIIKEPWLCLFNQYVNGTLYGRLRETLRDRILPLLVSYYFKECAGPELRQWPCVMKMPYFHSVTLTPKDKISDMLFPKNICDFIVDYKRMHQATHILTH